METTTTSTQVPLRTHRDFIEWVTSHIGGENNHYKERPINYNNCIPDVCISRENQLMEMHEVEVLRIGRKRVAKYNKFPRPKSILWICIPPLEKAFDEIRVIANFRKPTKTVESVTLRPRRQIKGTLVYIRCPDCNQTFNNIKSWDVHLIDCKKYESVDEMKTDFEKGGGCAFT